MITPREGHRGATVLPTPSPATTHMGVGEGVQVSDTCPFVSNGRGRLSQTLSERRSTENPTQDSLPSCINKCMFGEDPFPEETEDLSKYTCDEAAEDAPERKKKDHITLEAWIKSQAEEEMSLKMECPLDGQAKRQKTYGVIAGVKQWRPSWSIEVCTKGTNSTGFEVATALGSRHQKHTNGKYNQ